jgi:hypothetical protein
VQLSAITKLRLAFIALAVALLVPLGWLIHSVNVRVEAQRRLRHQVVADRIFDELERELTRVLAEQSARPSRDFDELELEDAPQPYVVGYFSADGRSMKVVNGAVISAAQQQRVASALAQRGVLPEPASSGAAEAQVQVPSEPSALLEAQKKPSSKVAPSKSLSGAEILRKLNRASDERQQLPSRP